MDVDLPGAAAGRASGARPSSARSGAAAPAATAEASDIDGVAAASDERGRGEHEEEVAGESK
jgi:hypothetical protein